MGRIRRAIEARSAAAVERRRLGQLARRTATTTNLFGTSFKLVDGASFLAQYRDFFERPGYAVRFDGRTPRIVDCGANVGVSVFFWKQISPAARITAFEADPEIAAVLRANTEAAGFHDVEVVAAAVWTEAGTVPFAAEGADAGRVGHGQLVPAVRLRDYLDSRVDLLKLDVEGAEVSVLLDCGEALRNVERIVLEYHSYVGEEQHLADLLRLLQDVGFRLILDSEYAPESPLLQLPPPADTDNRLIVYGVRRSAPGGDLTHA